MAGPSYGYNPQPMDMGRKPTSGLAIAGFIIAVIPITALLGVILSFISIFLTGPSSDRKGRGLAISGTVIGLIWCAAGGWLAYNAWTVGAMALDEGQKVFAYGMEIRAEKYKDEVGHYPETTDEFWSYDLNELKFEEHSGGEGLSQSQRADFSGFAQLVRYKAPSAEGERPSIFGIGMDGLAGTADDVKHVWGHNPLGDLKGRLVDHPFVSEEMAAAIITVLEEYYEELRTKPFEMGIGTTQPTPGEHPTPTE